MKLFDWCSEIPWIAFRKEKFEEREREKEEEIDEMLSNFRTYKKEPPDHKD